MNPSVDLYSCGICRISCSGPESYFQHISSVKHQKKEKLQHLDTVTRESNSLTDNPHINYLIPPAAPETQAASFTGSNFYCAVCQSLMTGPESYNSHMKGAPHAKKLKRKNLMQEHNLALPLPQQEIAEPVQSAPLVSSLANTTDAQKSQVGLPGSYYCDVCLIKMSGPESYSSHMLGGPHAKKLKQQKFIQQLDQDTNPKITSLSLGDD